MVYFAAMSERKKPDWRALFQIAFSQGGYFRTAQAAAAGFSNQLLRKHRLMTCRASGTSMGARSS